MYVLHQLDSNHFIGGQAISGNSDTLSADGTFTLNDGMIHIIDPGGAARNYNPTGSFPPYIPIILINIADAAETITFEPTFTAAGAHDGANNAAILTDSGESWVTNQLVGKTITNTTDSSSGIITANTGTTVTATLTGGTDNDWDTGDNYTIAPSGLNQAVAQNERAIFVYDGAGGWRKVYVGS